MSYVKKRTALRRENLKSRLEFEMSRAYELDKAIANIKKDIVGIREENVSMILKNNELKFQEPILDKMLRLNLKDKNGITSYMNNQQKSKIDSMDIFSKKLNVVIDDYKNISEEINNSVEEFKDHDYYKDADKELAYQINLQKDELDSYRYNLEISRQQWTADLKEREKLLKTLCEMDEEK